MCARHLRNGRGRVAVGDGNKTRAGDLLPGGMMELRKIAGAGAGDAECLGRHGSSYMSMDAKGKPAMLPALFLAPCLRFNDIRQQAESERAMSESLWEVYAVKYADRNNRTRFESFMFDPLHHLPHAMDYFVWVLKSEGRTVLVDTGYDPRRPSVAGGRYCAIRCRPSARLG